MDLNSPLTMSLRNQACTLYSRTKLILSEPAMLAILICSVLNTYYKVLTITSFLWKFHFGKYRSAVFVHSLFLSSKVLGSCALVKNDSFAFSLVTDVSAALRWWLERSGGGKGPDLSVSLFSHCQSHLYWPLNCVRIPPVPKLYISSPFPIPATDEWQLS